jgi:hypothetical protein
MDAAPEDDIRITDEDLAAADELWANAKFPSEEKRESFRKFSAYLHAKWGDHKFRVRYGLKPASTKLEMIEAEYFQGRVTEERFREKYRAYVTRLPDQEMLDDLLRGLEKRLDQYARFMQSIVDLAHDLPRASLRRADRKARAMRGKTGMSKEELATVVPFLTEARIRQGRTVVSSRGFTMATVVELIWKVIDSASILWKSAKRIAHESQTGTRYAYAITAHELFWKSHFAGLPPASELQALIIEEHAIGRLVLAADAKQAARTAEALHVNLHGNNIHINVADKGVAAPPAPGKPVLPLLSVSAWEELALGIDETKRVWAITPPSADGAVFHKREAIRVPIRKGDGFTLLTALAESPTGRSADIYAVAARLGLMPPSSSLQPDGRSHRDALRRGQTDEMELRGAPWRKKLNDILSGIGARLRKVVMGPVGKGASALSMDEEFVTSGFIVRHLHQDENRHLRFSVKPA